MERQKNSSQSPSLHDLIEIIREPQPAPASDSSFPTQLPAEIDESSPLYTLKQLADSLEAVFADASERDEASLAPHDTHRPHSSTDLSNLERHIELFQRQSAVLRRLMSKLN